MLTLVSIKIQDEIQDAHLFQHSNATCLNFLLSYAMEFLSHAFLSPYISLDQVRIIVSEY